MELENLREGARDLLSDMVSFRRTLHQWPELGNDLPITRDTVLEALDGLPLEVTLHESTSGIAALLDGGKPGPTVLLRADMDALPLTEATDLDFSSRNDGTMHACGHDTHTSMLVGAARLLSTQRADIPGRVLFMFQPGEEGSHGARFMLEEGLLDLPARSDGSESPVKGASALDITSSLATGCLSCRGGSIMAAADTMFITVKGRGGHASEPYRALDPIPIACEIVQALQTMVTRRIDVFDPAVVTVGKITAGTVNNIIPETAEIEGTIRAVSERTRRAVHDGIRRVAEGIAAAHDAEVTVTLVDGYPVTINDKSQADAVLGLADALVGADKTLRLANPIMGAEDFSYVLQKVAGAMVFLGGTHVDRRLSTAAPNHSNHVVFDEEAMVTGTAMYAAMALDHLGV